MPLADRAITRFGGRPRTWRLRRVWLRARFTVARRLFGARYSWEETTARAHAVPYLLRNAILPVLFAIVLVVGIDLLDGLAADVAKDVGWKQMSADTYDVLFEAVAGVTGVFLALYFTAVSTVAASVYINVPHDIRALIVRDRLGNVYVTGVAFTMAVSVLLLISHALSNEAYWLAPILVGFLAAFSIFAFIRLGQRAFYLADPTLLANTLSHDFLSWFQRATHDGGWRSDDASFQDHYGRQARKTVSSLVSLLAIAGDQPHLRGGSLRQLIGTIVAVLTGYLGGRARVPTKSRWFGERYEHKQWYLTDSTELETATSTSTTLHPRSVPDVSWVEQEMVSALFDVVDHDLEREEFEDAYLVIERLEPVWTQLGQAWSAQDAARWTRRLTDLVFARFASLEQPIQISRPALVPGIWDVLAMLPMSVELGFHRNVTDHTVEHIADELRTTDWSRDSAPYSRNVPRPVVALLEQMREGRRFERDVGAARATTTPNWYVTEIALHAYERDFQEQISQLVDLLTDWYPATAKRLTDAGLHDAAGAVLSRGLEVEWKLSRHVRHWEEIGGELRAGPFQVDLVRPERDWASLRGKIVALRRSLLQQLALSIPAQALGERTEEIPDFLGHAVHHVGEAALEALLDNESELFKELFPTYFIGVLVVVERIRPQVTEWHPSEFLTAIAEPVMDAMELSGYALICSELHGNPSLWQPCTDAWDRYLGDQNDGARRLQIVAAMHNHERNLFGITHRAIGRTRWQMALNRALEELPRDEPDHFFQPGAVRHDSPLIRRIAPHDDLVGSMFQASDIFVIRHLETIEGAADLDFGVADWVREELDRLDEDDEEEAS
jgi:hypothetical protein